MERLSQQERASQWMTKQKLVAKGAKEGVRTSGMGFSGSIYMLNINRTLHL